MLAEMVVVILIDTGDPESNPFGLIQLMGLVLIYMLERHL